MKTIKQNTPHIALLLILTLLSGLITPALSAKAAATVENQAIANSDLTWNLENGELRITGTGSIPDQGLNESDSGSAVGTTKAPWAEYLTEITSLVIEDGVTSIGDYAFTGCSKMTQVSVAGSVSYIGEYAFAETGLTGVNLPQSVTEIDRYAFYGCSNLTTVVLPSQLKEIDTATFAYCQSLTSITLPNTLESICSDAFLLCAALPKISIPASVSYIGMAAFTGCSNLKIYAPADSYTATTWAPNNPDFTVIVEEDESDNNEGDNDEGDNDEGNNNEGDNADDPTEEITLDAPTNFRAQIVESGIQLNWTLYPDDSVDTYIIRRKQGDGEWQSVFSGEGLQMTDYKDTTELEPGATYTYELKVSNGTQTSEAATTTITIPLADTTSPVIGDMAPAEGAQVAKETTLQVTASDDNGLQKAVFSYCTENSSEWIHIGTDEAAAGDETTDTTFQYAWTLPADLEGTVTIRAQVYDTTTGDDANAPAELQHEVTVLKYIAPVAPVVQAENNYLKAKVSWTYERTPSAFLKQFVLYKTDENGENRQEVAVVKRALSASYTVSLEENESTWIVVEAQDYFGETCRSAPVAVSSKRDITKPNAVITTQTTLAIAGEETVFSAADSSDNVGITSYSWDFDGDGEADVEGTDAAEVSYTYAEAGTYTVTLTVADAAGNQSSVSTDITVCEIGGTDSEYALVTITVKNAFDESLAAVESAQLQLIYQDEEGEVTFEVTAVTGQNGTVTFPAPVGAATLLAAADGYMSQSRNVTVEADNNGRYYYSLGLAPADASFVSGELTVTPMTQEEMIEAGIDIDDPDNQHVWKYETTMTFVVAPGVKGVEITPTSFINEAGKLLATENNWFQIPYDTDDSGNDDPGSAGGSSGTDFGYMNVGVFPISENFVMVVYGQAHWLKEMFRVELVVMNNNYMYDITDCTATLNLPEGMSLAAMTGEEQSLEIDLGEIGFKGSENGNSKKAGWYIRGDEEGMYSLSASVEGMLGSVPFENTFTADEAIKVYAGSALKLKVTADNVAFWGEDYHIRYELTNESEVTLYNMAFAVNGLELTQNIHMVKMGTAEIIKGTRVLEKEDFAAEKQISFDELEPGDTLVVDIFCKPLFLSMAQWVDLGPIEAAYYLTDMFTTTMEGSSTEIPTEVDMVPVTHGTLEEWLGDQIGEQAKDTTVNIFTGLMDLGDISFLGTAAKIYKFAAVGREIYETEPTLIITLNKSEGSFARMGTRTMSSSNSDVVTIYTDADPADYQVEEDGENLIMTITGDAKIYVQGSNPGEAEVTFTTWAAPHEYALDPDTETMEMTLGRRDLTYTATFTVPDEEGDSGENTDEPFQISQTNVIMGNTLDMLFAFKQSEQDDWTGYFAELERTYADGRRNEKVIVRSEDWTSNGNFYTVTYDGLYAKEMCDTVTITIYDNNGNEVSEPLTESIRSYALRVLEETENDGQKVMLVNMLNYGAAAQQEFSYNTSDLANTSLTAAQKALADYEIDPVDSVSHGDKWVSGTFDPEENLIFTIQLSELEQGQYARVEYTGHKGNTESVRVEGSASIQIKNMVVADARCPVTVTVYNADDTKAFVVKDSVAAAVDRSGADELLTAYLKFADSAHTYLHDQEQE